MKSRQIFAFVALASITASCSHFEKTDRQTEIAVPAKLSITRGADGVFDFKYDAPFADSEGNFDFSKGDPYGKVVLLSFSIVDDMGLGLKFKPDGRDAMWIVDKRFVGPDGSPEGPFRGQQWTNFDVSADGRTLTVRNQNDDGILYRYGLRFDMGSETVIDDPDSQNGSGGHSGSGT
jgi:hypothetical protein